MIGGFWALRLTQDASLKVTGCLNLSSELEWGRPNVGEGLQTLAQSGRRGLKTPTYKGWVCGYEAVGGQSRSCTAATEGNKKGGSPRAGGGPALDPESYLSVTRQ